MKKVIQNIRIAAIIIGCSIIFIGIFFNCFNFVNQVIHQSAYQPFHYTLIIGTIYGFASSFFQGTVIVLLALIMNPDKVVPLFYRKEDIKVEEEIIDNKNE